MEQTQSSAPWFRPPNTLCNTDGWRRTRKSAGKITVRSAQKTGEAKKETMERKTKSYWEWPSDGPDSHPPDPGDRRDTALCPPPRALPPPRSPHPPPSWAALQRPATCRPSRDPGEVSEGAPDYGGAERRAWPSPRGPWRLWRPGSVEGIR